FRPTTTQADSPAPRPAVDTPTPSVVQPASGKPPRQPIQAVIPTTDPRPAAVTVAGQVHGMYRH
ncbi:MAG: hypothetical protein ACOYMG_29570, partial [Candidatus Methylumidiphilus sp.]